MIKEFDLDVPKQQKPTRLQFRNETRCVTALFERCYKPSSATGKPWKVLVEVVDGVKSETHIDMLGVLIVQVDGTVHDFFDMTAAAKMEKALKYLMTGITKVSEQRGWDIAPFLDAETKVRGLKFKNEWVWRSPVKNGSRSLSAEVLIRHQIEKAEISARFTDRDGNVVKVEHLVSDTPNDFIFFGYLGTFEWQNDNTVELISRDGQKRFIAHAV